MATNRRLMVLAVFSLLLTLPWIARGSERGDGTAPMVIFGDSIAVGALASRGNRTYVARITRDSRKYAIMNHSRGAWIASRTSPVWWITPADVDGVRALCPSVVLVALGTNDFAAGIKLESFRNGYRALLETIAAPGLEPVRIYCLTSLSRLDEDTPNLSGLVLDDYRAVAEEECTSIDGQAIDGRHILPRSPDYLSPDGLHPNDRGHREIARHLQQHMTGEFD